MLVQSCTELSHNDLPDLKDQVLSALERRRLKDGIQIPLLEGPGIKFSQSFHLPNSKLTKFQEDKSTSKFSNSPSLVLHGIEYPINLDIARKPEEDWWTRSEWAFLNEPPLDTASKSCQSYTPQFHVAQLATPKYGEAK
ncbi:hypothetical protein RJ641_004652 [Dillenia turbinata]|uniref:Uncharacterized protein n=1 Tax=Dillenia turbinata TaxID=194707 RepID=A0AAN8ZE94_9MAGN